MASRTDFIINRLGEWWRHIAICGWRKRWSTILDLTIIRIFSTDIYDEYSRFSEYSITVDNGPLNKVTCLAWNSSLENEFCIADEVLFLFLLFLLFIIISLLFKSFWSELNLNHESKPNIKCISFIVSKNAVFSSILHWKIIFFQKKKFFSWR